MNTEMSAQDGHSQDDGEPLSPETTRLITAFLVLAAIVGCAIPFLTLYFVKLHSDPLSLVLIFVAVFGLVSWLGNKTFAALAIR